MVWKRGLLLWLLLLVLQTIFGNVVKGKVTDAKSPSKTYVNGNGNIVINLFHINFPNANASSYLPNFGALSAGAGESTLERPLVSSSGDTSSHNGPLIQIVLNQAAESPEDTTLDSASFEADSSDYEHSPDSADISPSSGRNPESFERAGLNSRGPNTDFSAERIRDFIKTQSAYTTTDTSRENYYTVTDASEIGSTTRTGETHFAEEAYVTELPRPIPFKAWYKDLLYGSRRRVGTRKDDNFVKILTSSDESDDAPRSPLDGSESLGHSGEWILKETELQNVNKDYSPTIKTNSIRPRKSSNGYRSGIKDGKKEDRVHFSVGDAENDRQEEKENRSPGSASLGFGVENTQTGNLGYKEESHILRELNDEDSVGNYSYSKVKNISETDASVERIHAPAEKIVRRLKGKVQVQVANSNSKLSVGLFGNSLVFSQAATSARVGRGRLHAESPSMSRNVPTPLRPSHTTTSEGGAEDEPDPSRRHARSLHATQFVADASTPGNFRAPLEANRVNTLSEATAKDSVHSTESAMPQRVHFRTEHTALAPRRFRAPLRLNRTDIFERASRESVRSRKHPLSSPPSHFRAEWPSPTPRRFRAELRENQIKILEGAIMEGSRRYGTSVRSPVRKSRGGLSRETGVNELTQQNLPGGIQALTDNLKAVLQRLSEDPRTLKHFQGNLTSDPRLFGTFLAKLKYGLFPKPYPQPFLPFPYGGYPVPNIPQGFPYHLPAFTGLVPGAVATQAPVITAAPVPAPLLTQAPAIAADTTTQVPSTTAPFVAGETTTSLPVSLNQTCCVSTTESPSFFSNPSFPARDVSTPGACAMTIKPLQESICQLRVDFQIGNLLSPSEGQCVNQALKFAGTIWPLGIASVCGFNDGQHLYIHLDRSVPLGQRYASIILQTNLRGQMYSLQLKITQIDCSKNLATEAPAGCLQYLTGGSGSFSSFNFGAGQYLSGAHYKICIRTPRTACKIQFSSGIGQFMLEKFGSDQTVPYTRSGVSSKYCVQDYLLLPGGSFDGEMPTQDRFCGGILNPVQGSTEFRPVIAKLSGSIYTVEVHTGVPRNYFPPAHTGFNVNYRFITGPCPPIEDVPPCATTTTTPNTATTEPTTTVTETTRTKPPTTTESPTTTTAGYGPPNPPSGSYGVPQHSQGYGVPQKGYGVPINSFSETQKGYGIPTQNSPVPQQNYGVPQKGYSVPNNSGSTAQMGYSVPQTGYGTPQLSHSLPSNTYGTPIHNPNYGMPQNSYSVPKKDYAAPQQNYGVPLKGYVPEKGYNTPQQSYGTPQQTYTIPQQSHATHSYADLQNYGAPGYGQHPLDLNSLIPIYSLLQQYFKQPDWSYIAALVGQSVQTAQVPTGQPSPTISSFPAPPALSTAQAPPTPVISEIPHLITSSTTAPQVFVASQTPLSVSSTQPPLGSDPSTSFTPQLSSDQVTTPTLDPLPSSTFQSSLEPAAPQIVTPGPHILPPSQPPTNSPDSSLTAADLSPIPQYGQPSTALVAPPVLKKLAGALAPPPVLKSSAGNLNLKKFTALSLGLLPPDPLKRILVEDFDKLLEEERVSNNEVKKRVLDESSEDSDYYYDE